MRGNCDVLAAVRGSQSRRRHSFTSGVRARNRGKRWSVQARSPLCYIADCADVTFVTKGELVEQWRA
jgi:hypothetical protein